MTDTPEVCPFCKGKSSFADGCVNIYCGLNTPPKAEPTDLPYDVMPKIDLAQPPIVSGVYGTPIGEPDLMERAAKHAADNPMPTDGAPETNSEWNGPEIIYIGPFWNRPSGDQDYHDGDFSDIRNDGSISYTRTALHQAALAERDKWIAELEVKASHVVNTLRTWQMQNLKAGPYAVMEYEELCTLVQSIEDGQ